MTLADLIYNSLALYSKQTVVDMTRPVMQYEVEIVDQDGNIMEFDKAAITTNRRDRKIQIFVTNHLENHQNET